MSNPYRDGKEPAPHHLSSIRKVEITCSFDADHKALAELEPAIKAHLGKEPFFFHLELYNDPEYLEAPRVDIYAVKPEWTILRSELLADIILRILQVKRIRLTTIYRGPYHGVWNTNFTGRNKQ